MTTPSSQQKSSLPTSFSELILPDKPNLSQTLTSLKKSRLSIHNRLVSIAEDSTFVSAAAAANNLPLVANERCGSWYVDPVQKKGSVYFKSTDGHQGQWSFSLRRLNLGLLEVLGKHHGAIVVDSTRRGKSMPDALSKTVPIWVAVMNRVLFPDAHAFHKLCTPGLVVSKSETAQIASKIDRFVEDLLNLDLDLEKLRTMLSMPIRLEFITRQTTVLRVEQYTEAHTLICCSASRHERGDGDAYVQGAGDDIETWAAGLTAQLYWQYKDQLLSEPNEEILSEMIQTLSQEPSAGNTGSCLQISLKEHPTSLFMGSFSIGDQIDITGFDGIVCCDFPAASIISASTSSQSRPFVLSLGCPSGKLGGKALREKLPLLDDFVIGLLNKKSVPEIAVLSSDGRDLAVGTALALLCRWIDDAGKYRGHAFQDINKSFIRRKLACITDTLPAANPSRATLQSVNTYLMGHTF